MLITIFLLYSAFVHRTPPIVSFPVSRFPGFPQRDRCASLCNGAVQRRTFLRVSSTPQVSKYKTQQGCSHSLVEATALLGSQGSSQTLTSRMAGNHSRMSVYSNLSGTPRPSNQPSAQLSTTTLLNALHTSYTSGQPYSLEASTSVAVNTWASALHGATIDVELGQRAWEHARRRAEDGCIVLGYVMSWSTVPKTICLADKTSLQVFTRIHTLAFSSLSFYTTSICTNNNLYRS